MFDPARWLWKCSVMTERYTDWRFRKSRRLRSLSSRRAIYTLHKLRSCFEFEGHVKRSRSCHILHEGQASKTSFSSLLLVVGNLFPFSNFLWCIKYSMRSSLVLAGPGLNALLLGKGGYALKYASPSEGKLQRSFWMSWPPESMGMVVPASLCMFLWGNTPSCHDLVLPSSVPFFLFVCLSVCLSACLSFFLTTLAHQNI